MIHKYVSNTLKYWNLITPREKKCYGSLLPTSVKNSYFRLIQIEAEAYNMTSEFHPTADEGYF